MVTAFCHILSTTHFQNQIELTRIVARQFGIIFSRVPHAITTQLAGFHIVNGFHVTEAHALRVSVTQVTFENTAALWIPSHGSEGTRRDTHLATNAKVMIDSDAVHLFVAINCIFRTDGHAGSISAVLAAHRHIESFVVPFDDMNTG